MQARKMDAERLGQRPGVLFEPHRPPDQDHERPGRQRPGQKFIAQMCR